MSESVGSAGQVVVEISQHLSEHEKKRARIRNEVARIKDLVLCIPPDADYWLDALEPDGLIEAAAKLPKSRDIEIAQHICQHFTCLSKYDEHAVKSEIARLRAEGCQQDTGSSGSPGGPEESRASRQKSATEQDYYNLFEDTLSPLRRDIFSGKLMTLDTETQLWEPARNLEEVLKARAYNRSDETDTRYAVCRVRSYLTDYERNKPRELLVEIPEWDGEDRIKLLASCLTLRASAGLESQHAEELIKDWFATAFRRLDNPEVRNRILILHGNQNIGKDWWIEALVGGLGQFAFDLAVDGHDKDTMLSLHDGMVAKISEFDQTARLETARLKAMITQPSTHMRAHYDAERKHRKSRVSFISSCNIDDIFRDSTGHTRFIVLELDGIRFDYPRDDYSKKQILAQARQLASSGYKASRETEQALSEYLGQRTPEDPATEIVELWRHEAGLMLRVLQREDLATWQEITERGWFTNSQCMEGVIRASRFAGTTVRKVLNALSRKGFGRRNKTVRGYDWMTTDERRLEAQKTIEF